MVLTQLTQTAIAVLNDITTVRHTIGEYLFIVGGMERTIRKLVESGISSSVTVKKICSFLHEICRSIQKLSLLELLAIILMNLHLERQVSETSYFHHSRQPRNWESLPRWCVFYPK